MRRLLPYLFICFLAALPYTGVKAAPIPQQQAATSYQGIVNTTANIRGGPSTQYDIVGQAQSGQIITVVACNEDCSWYKLDNGNWIAAFLVDLVSTSGSSASDASGNTSSEPSSGSGGTRSRVIDPDDLVLNEASPAALEVVEQILSYTGLPQSFDVYSANIYNAAALMVKGKRVILYDPQLIADIENITNHDWPAVSILAHEIGHHLAGHTLATEYNRAYELEADYFSGFILQKMGSTLDEAQAVMSLLRDHPNMTDHPPQAERLVTIERGWQDAARQQGLAWEPNFSGFADEAATNTATSVVPSVNVELINALQAAQNAQREREAVAVVLAATDWGIGLRALAASTSE